jgi:hypothetical protein
MHYISTTQFALSFSSNMGILHNIGDYTRSYN